jgi:HPt (histidine-containing phosphotransfer) domain-containing protein
MAYDVGGLSAALAAAVGEDAALVAELRGAMIGGAKRHADLLARSRCDANWAVAAHRLKGLAASFSAIDLIAAADLALESAPGDPVALRRVERAIAILEA